MEVFFFYLFQLKIDGRKTLEEQTDVSKSIRDVCLISVIFYLHIVLPCCFSQAIITYNGQLTSNFKYIEDLRKEFGRQKLLVYHLNFQICSVRETYINDPYNIFTDISIQLTSYIHIYIIVYCFFSLNYIQQCCFVFYLFIMSAFKENRTRLYNHR